MAKQDYIDSIKELNLSTSRLRELKREMIEYVSEKINFYYKNIRRRMLLWKFVLSEPVMSD